MGGDSHGENLTQVSLQFGKFTENSTSPPQNPSERLQQKELSYSLIIFPSLQNAKAASLIKLQIGSQITINRNVVCLVLVSILYELTNCAW